VSLEIVLMKMLLFHQGQLQVLQEKWQVVGLGILLVWGMPRGFLLEGQQEIVVGEHQ
jgi:hypothetical protein